jgi:hypothetical protein
MTEGESVLVDEGRRPETRYVSRFMVGFVRQVRYTPYMTFQTVVRGAPFQGQIAPTPGGYSFVYYQNTYQYGQYNALEGMRGEHMDFFEAPRTAWEDVP